MPDKKVEKIYYTDTLAAARRFEEVKARKLQQKKEEDIRKAIRQGHGGGFDADTLDEYHAEDLLKEMDNKISKIPRRGHGGGGGGGTTWYNDTGAPIDTLGSDGDYYIDITSGDLYYRINNSWMLIGNIHGGLLNGSIWYDGEGAPS